MARPRRSSLARRRRGTSLLSRVAMLLALACIAGSVIAADASDRRLLVDTRALTLSVLEQGQPQITLHAQNRNQ